MRKPLDWTFSLPVQKLKAEVLEHRQKCLEAQAVHEDADRRLNVGQKIMSTGCVAPIFLGFFSLVGLVHPNAFPAIGTVSVVLIVLGFVVVLRASNKKMKCPLRGFRTDLSYALEEVLSVLEDHVPKDCEVRLSACFWEGFSEEECLQKVQTYGVEIYQKRLLEGCFPLKNGARVEVTAERQTRMTVEFKSERHVDEPLGSDGQFGHRTVRKLIAKEHTDYFSVLIPEPTNEAWSLFPSLNANHEKLEPEPNLLERDGEHFATLEVEVGEAEFSADPLLALLDWTFARLPQK